MSKHYETKVGEGVCKIVTCTKNPSLHFKEHCTKIDDFSHIFIHFFFSQANLLFLSLNQCKFKNYKLHKNYNLNFKEYYTKKDDISHTFVEFFFSDTNLFFEFKPVFVNKLDSFHHNLFYLLIIDILPILEFIQFLYKFYFDDFQSQKVLNMFLFPMTRSYLLPVNKSWR